ncbi:MAG TPA: asparagine synthase (glutamine-hydrolyzing) [Verrucomicrobiae bacterium]|jgi:asparagine synthase (glutamine-hydrolysing)|nr:asparagine synthase (glutamine-hydrolyzing) [Verrucomicrobiae bacterium]
MCGIAGIWFAKAEGRERLETSARAMGGAMSHRGPDAEGIWTDAPRGLALTHRRLSILDLTEAGAQPMHSHCGRFVIIYNGECYNFTELRNQLVAAGCVFRGSSDTEVIVESCARWGVHKTLEHLNGMFAFALWDRQTGELVLARDRIGIKPLFYGWFGGAFWFGSELKALRALKEFKPELNVESIGQFLKYGYIPAPHSVFKGIFKLPAAHLLTMKSASEKASPECYWSVVRDWGQKGAHAFKGTAAEAQEQLDQMLRKSVRGQMISDVPLGAFLSGGVDSSTVVAMMQAESTRPVKTFTIGFEEAGFNEAESAREVARHLKTDHTDLVLTAGEAQAIVPMLGQMFDEPFADASQIPTFAVSRLARKHVTVSLSGDGGDELFAGYRHYTVSAGRLNRLNRIPSLARKLASGGARIVSERGWDRVFNLIPAGDNASGFKVHKYASLLGHGNAMSQYDLINSRWFAPETVVRGLSNGAARAAAQNHAAGLDLIELMAVADLNQYLPEDILVKLDRASMAVSLESRVPLLDHDVVAFALSLPLEYKRSNGTGKVVLRRVLEKYVPREIIDRPKKGFSVPIAQWVRGPLRDWAEDLLEKNRGQHGELMDQEIIGRKWREHLAGRRDNSELLWPVLMFESWAQQGL